jgi:cobalamin biosynthesis protein CobC
MSGIIVHGGGVTAAAAAFGGRPQDWLDLSTGINPNPVAIPAIPVDVWHRLPDAHLVESASRAAQAYYRSGKSLPLPVPGTQSVIQLLPKLTGAGQAGGRRVAILSPTYGEYGRAFENAGCTVDRIDDLSTITPEHVAVVVVNPNNPTGRVFGRDVLLALAERLARQNTWLIVDEAFGDMQMDESVAGFTEALDRLIVFRSFGKFFGLAGLRLGFVMAQKDVLARFSDWLGPWAVSGPALFLAANLLGADTQAIAAHISSRKAGLDAVLDTAGLDVIGGTGLFSLVQHPQASALWQYLAQNHILVRRFDYAPDWLRIGLSPDAGQDARLAQALEQWSAGR